MTEFYTWLSPPNVDSIRRYLSEDQLRAGSEAYVCHANTRYDLQERDIAQRYITADPESLPLEVYVNAVQRLHGEHLAACADQYRRSISICGGALFWMYNDCWPTSSWTTHDYYVRRKALFYYMKRAFAPVNVTFEEEDSGLSVWVSNLTSHEFRGMLRYGRYAFPTGDKSDEWDKKVRVKAGTSARIAFFYTPLAYPWEALGSFGHATLANDAGETISSGSKLFATYKGLSGEEFSMPPSFWAHRSVQLPKIRLERLTADRLVVTTDVPAFSVRVEAEDCLPDDNCFDLMPGECKVVRLERGLPSPDPPVSTLNEVIVFLRDRRL